MISIENCSTYTFTRICNLYCDNVKHIVGKSRRMYFTRYDDSFTITGVTISNEDGMCSRWRVTVPSGNRLVATMIHQEKWAWSKPPTDVQLVELKLLGFGDAVEEIPW